MSSGQQNWLLSGGIGSGKSTVRKMLDARGVQTIDADSIGHEVLTRGGAAVSDVADEWPDVVVGGTVDRERLAAIVFNDRTQLLRLEQLTHPHIFSEIATRVKDLNAPVVLEVPLIVQPFESNWPRMIVDAPDDVRLRRAAARGQDEDDVKSRMESQPRRAEWLAAADMVVPNSGGLDELEKTVERIYQSLCR